MGLDMAFLQGILGLGIVAQDAARHPGKATVVLAHQPFEGARYAGDDAKRQHDVRNRRACRRGAGCVHDVLHLLPIGCRERAKGYSRRAIHPTPHGGQERARAGRTTGGALDGRMVGMLHAPCARLLLIGGPSPHRLVAT